MSYLPIIIAIIATIATIACAIIAWLDRRDCRPQAAPPITPICLTVLGVKMNRDAHDLAGHGRGASRMGFHRQG